MLDLLRGGDRRMIGRSEQVAARVSKAPELFPELIAGLWAEDPPFSPSAPDTVPGDLEQVEFIVKDSKRFSDTHGWGYAMFVYDTASGTCSPRPRRPATLRWVTTPGAAPHATSWRRQRITFLRHTLKGKPHQARCTSRFLGNPETGLCNS
jgi:hypothetical protein